MARSAWAMSESASTTSTVHATPTLALRRTRSDPMSTSTSSTPALAEVGGFRVVRVYGLDEVVVYVYGEMDLATAPRLSNALVAALRSDCRVIIDLAELSFIDSQGIRALVQAFKASETGVAERLVLRSPRPQARKVLELTGLAEVLRIDG